MKCCLLEYLDYILNVGLWAATAALPGLCLTCFVQKWPAVFAFATLGGGLDETNCYGAQVHDLHRHITHHNMHNFRPN